jgi:hypothetical protein
LEPPPRESLRGRTSEANYRISVDGVNQSSTDRRNSLVGRTRWQTSQTRQIAHTDGEIDRLVYELYGLGALTLALSHRAREIELVEGATA